MNTWSISRRLITGFGAVLALITVLVTCFEASLHALDSHVGTITRENIPGMINSSEALENSLTYRVLTLQHLLTNDPAEWRKIETECETLAAQTLENLAAYEKTITTAENREFFAKVGPAYEHYRTVATQMRQLNRNGDHAGARALAGGAVAQAFSTYENAVLELTSFNQNFGRESAEKISATMTRTRIVVTTICVAGLVCTVGAGFLLTRRITRSIREVSHALSEGSAHVSGAASHISSASQALALGSTEQAATVEETSASLAEMSAMTKRNAAGAQQAKELSAQTRACADAGAAHMAEMREAMDAIKRSSDDIAKIIKSIDEIAFQTNILALNAAVEAARAGEAGMGFAVVAEEVRGLAQRSAQSAKETATKIEDAIRKSEHGVAISSSVAAALAEVVEKARKVDAFVAEIAQASKEQNQGIDQLNSAVGQIGKVTHSTAGNAEETAVAAQQLASQAAAMRSAVASLEALVHGGRTAVEPVAAPSHPPRPVVVREQKPAPPNRPSTPPTPLPAPRRRPESRVAHPAVAAK